MKRSLARLFAASLAAMAVLCSCGPKMIPEQTMQAIFRESLINQAVLAQLGDQKFVHLDSLDTYSALLHKYGYTMDDLRYSVRKLAVRKSNPIGNLLVNVANDIRLLNEQAQARYRVQLRIDTLAQVATADTLLRDDTVMVGELKKFRFELKAAPEHYYPDATYRIEFDYSTGPHARPYSKTLEYHFYKPGGELRRQGSLWLQSTDPVAHFREEVISYGSVNRFEFTMVESSYGAETIPDTSLVKNFQLTRVWPVKQARKRYYRALTGFIPLNQLYDERYAPKDSTALRPLPPRWER